MELEKEKQLKLIELRKAPTLGEQMNINQEITELNTQLTELYRQISDPILKKTLEDLFKGADKNADNFNNLLKSITREIELLKLETDRAKELLQVQFELEDTIEKAKKSADKGEEIIIAARERARLKIIAINEKYDAIDLQNAKKHSEDLEAIENEKDKFYSLFNKKEDERSKNEAKRRQIEKGEIGRVLAEDILALKKRSKSREEFEKGKDKLIQEAIKKEIKSIEIALLADRLSIEERIKLQTKLANLKSSLIGFEQSDLEKLQGALSEVQELVSGMSDAMAMLSDAELSREERKTAMLNNELKERLRNENLSAKERERINKQIEANELALQKRRDEIAERNFRLQKAFAIAQAAINTALAVTDVLRREEGGLIKKSVAAIAIGILGAAQIAAIASTKFVPTATSVPSGVGGISGGAGAAPAQQEPVFNIVGTGTQMQLAETVAQRTGEPIKAFVVSNDITTAQELDRNIITGSAIG